MDAAGPIVPESRAGSRARPRGRTALALGLVAAAALAVYARTFDVPFQFDDAVTFESPRVRDPAAAVRGLWESPPRSLGTLTFALDRALHGDRVAGYHAVNLAVHVLACFLVYALVRLVLAAPRVRASPAAARAPEAAFAAALLFAVHPLHTQAVTYLVQRLASLAALLAFAAAAAYLRSARACEAGRPGARRGWLLAGLAAFAAACLVKQNAVTLPLALAAAEWALLRGTARERAARLAPFAAVAGAAALVLVLGSGDLASVTAQARDEGGFGPWSYFLAQLRVVPRYLGLLLWPAGQSVDHAVLPGRSLLEPGALGGLALLAGLFAAGLAATAGRAGRDPLWRAVGFGALWFFAGLPVESSFLPIADAMMEHRAYLPSAGLFLAAAALAALAAERLRRPRSTGRPGSGAVAAAPFALLFLCALPLGAAAAARNELWRDELVLWRDAAARAPARPRPWNNVGTTLARRGRHDEAAAAFRRALEADPRHEEAWRGLGMSLSALGRHDEAALALAEARRLRPFSADGALEEGNLLLARGRPALAVSSYEEASRLAPDRAGIRYNLGMARLAAGDSPGAERALAEALALDPRGDNGMAAAAHAQLGLLLGPAGRLEEAVRHLEAAVALGRDDPATLENLGAALLLAGRPGDAAGRLRAAVDRDPRGAGARYNLSLALRALGRAAEADAALEEARRLDPSLPGR